MAQRSHICAWPPPHILASWLPPNPNHHTPPPQILVMDEPRELRWKDDRGFFMNLFFHGSHWFVFKETPEGHTRMVHGAQLFGLALPFIQDTMAATARGYHVWNEALSQRVQQAILAAS